VTDQATGPASIALGAENLRASLRRGAGRSWVSRTGETRTSQCGASIATPSTTSSTLFGPVWKEWAASEAALFTAA
jgi:hypothetical protein